MNGLPLKLQAERIDRYEEKNGKRESKGGEVCEKNHTNNGRICIFGDLIFSYVCETGKSRGWSLDDRQCGN